MNSISTSITETQKPPVSGSLIAVIMVIIVEMMFFGGLVSAYILAEAGQIEWPPAGQPRLPFWLTFGNMIILLLSAYTMWLYIHRLKKEIVAPIYLKLSVFLGSLFFLIQGYEWARILLFGIQTQASLFTSFFYTIIGLHGFHVLVGLIILLYIWRKMSTQKVENQYNYAVSAGTFWFFVVALWPILYSLIYLN